jgi:hypothetical protein
MSAVNARTPALPYRTTADLEARLEDLRGAPADLGTVRLVVRRPGPGVREILEVGELTQADGLVGDTWLQRSTSRSVAAGRHFDAQVNVMSARMVGLLADTADEQAYAGDQLFLDLDLSQVNLPAGSQLAFGAPGAGGAVIEVSVKPHNGCAKFTARYGEDAMRFVNSQTGKALRLRGFNARVVQSGTVRPGDVVRVVARGGLDDQTDAGALEAAAV